jgi:[acyl-carrier-protein] S-malonyltransferase
LKSTSKLQNKKSTIFARCNLKIRHMKAYIFPGQGAQYPGMGKDLYEKSPLAKALFLKANEILGFNITNIMFEGTEEDLKQTNVTQPAIFLHSVLLAKTLENFQPEMVAGHSLGEFSALVANGALSFEDGLRLVSKRAQAMQKACQAEPSTMAAIVGLDDEVVEEVCASIDEIVVPANYNCPGQLVISGSMAGIDKACEVLTARGAKRAIKLVVGGAFHSPLMEPAREELAAAIEATPFSKPICPIYQNVNAAPTSDPEVIKQNLIAQLTAPVRWTQTAKNMIADGATLFTEIGPGKVLQGLIKKVDKTAEVAGVNSFE